MQKAASPQRAVLQLQKLCPKVPRLAIVLGSGFAGLAKAIEPVAEISYDKIPGFPRPTTDGHPGRVILGNLQRTPVLLLNGRSHFYEGRTLGEVTFPVRVLALLGVRDLLLTNAAGGINPRYRPGDFMVLRDHINALPENPLRGVCGPGKFVDLTHAYDSGLAKLLRLAARRVGVRAHSGVYLAVSGPSYETPAEVEAFARWGADAVGMSTVPEAIVARFEGLRVAGLSCITNFAAGRGKGLLSHAEVLRAGETSGSAAEKLLNSFLTEYAQSQ